jgi:predicted GNAT family N-acyltransferase
MSTLTIRTADWQTDKDVLRELRKTVFIEEQNVSPELEWDNNDESSRHWLAVDKHGKAIATARMQGDGHIGRMAVLKQHRNQGVGSALLQTIVDAANQQRLLEVYLYAQTQAEAFYRHCGFVAEGDEYMDAGIPHITMRKRLSEQRLLGVHGGKFAVHDFESSLLELIQQTERHLHILSYDLNPDVFDSNAMSEKLSSLARRSRYSEIKILIVDSYHMVKSGHRLIELQRRLPSSFAIRKITDNNTAIRDNWVIADKMGMIHQSIKEPELCWGNYYNRPLAEDYSAQFDVLWQHAHEDPELRRLEI